MSKLNDLSNILRCHVLETYQIILDPITSNSVTVKVIPPTGTPATVYTARIKDGAGSQSCQIAVDAEQCEITGLEPATMYTVEVLPCDTTTGTCNPVAEKPFTTSALPGR